MIDPLQYVLDHVDELPVGEDMDQFERDAYKLLDKEEIPVKKKQE